MKDGKRVRCQIFVEEKNGGTLWVPYKTLIGYGVGNRVILGVRGDYLYTDLEFASREAAVDEAKRRAWERIQVKFPDAGEQHIEWDVVQERAPLFVTA